MPFANTVLERWMSDGKFYERGRYVSTGGSTGGTITPQLTGNNLSAGIRQIYFSDFTSDTSAAVTKDMPVGSNTVTITTAANDTGEYTLNGFGC